MKISHSPLAGSLLCALAALARAPLSEAALADRIEKQAAADAEAAKYESAVTTPSPIADHFAIRASFISGAVNTQAQVNDTAAGLAGTQFTAESELGLPRHSAQGRAEFMFRLRNRGRLRVSALDLSRTGTAQVNRDLRYGNQLFRVNERVNTTFDWRSFDLTWLFSFIRNDRFELGTGIGMHFIQAETSASVPARGVRESFDGSGPFATLALDSTWRITRRFSLNARAQTFEVTASSISAKLFDWHADVQFRFHKNVALGAGYQSNFVRLDIADANPSGSIRFDVAGPELFLRASF
jgi:hypothetical protein